MGFYDNFLNQSLFLYSLEKNSKEFIEASLMNGAFEK